MLSFPVLSVCIPTLDMGSGRAQRLIDSITRWTTVSYEICVADCHGELRGYTAPMNEAMFKGRGQYLAAINDDVVVAENWFQKLREPLGAGAWCSTPDATHLQDGHQVFAPWLMLWERMAWYFMNGLDPRFSHWCSDIDIARRLVDRGNPPVKVFIEGVTHELNASSHDPALGAICNADLQLFYEKWGVDAEQEKHRLAALA